MPEIIWRIAHAYHEWIYRGPMCNMQATTTYFLNTPPPLRASIIFLSTVVLNKRSWRKRERGALYLLSGLFTEYIVGLCTYVCILPLTLCTIIALFLEENGTMEMEAAIFVVIIIGPEGGS